MDLGLSGRGYVITGGSQGLGLATARQLVSEGARVLLVARDEQRLADARSGLGPLASCLPLDLADPDAGERIAATARDEQMTDGILVNVGGPEPGSSMSYTDEQWQRAIDGVLMASIRVTRAVLPVVADGGALLYVLSNTVKEPIPSLGASNVLRPGLAMLVKELSIEAAPRAVRVNGILPGVIRTGRIVALTQGNPDTERDIARSIPLGRLGDPEEFGRAAAFLLSPAASYVTGVLVPVDGGALHSPW